MLLDYWACWHSIQAVPDIHWAKKRHFGPYIQDQIILSGKVILTTFLTFWYTLLYISGPMSLTGALMQVSPGEYYAMVGFNMLLMLVVVDTHEA